MSTEISRTDKIKALLGAVGLAVVVLLVAQPAVEAAVRAVRIKGAVAVKQPVKVRGIKTVSAQGLFDAPGSNGAIDVRTFGGGNGFLGAADCTQSTADGLRNVVETEGGNIVTGIIITGTDATVTVTSEAIDPSLPLLQFRATADNPNVALALGNGINTTAPVTFTCADGGSGRFVLIGQDD